MAQVSNYEAGNGKVPKIIYKKISSTKKFDKLNKGDVVEEYDLEAYKMGPDGRPLQSSTNPNFEAFKIGKVEKTNDGYIDYYQNGFLRYFSSPNSEDYMNSANVLIMHDGKNYLVNFQQNGINSISPSDGGEPIMTFDRINIDDAVGVDSINKKLTVESISETDMVTGVSFDEWDDKIEFGADGNVTSIVVNGKPIDLGILSAKG